MVGDGLFSPSSPSSPRWPERGPVDKCSLAFSKVLVLKMVAKNEYFPRENSAPFVYIFSPRAPSD